MRIAGRIAAVALALPVAAALHGMWRSARRSSPWPRRYMAWVARAIGARMETVGVPLDRDVVFVANHLSWIDIVALAGRTGTAFVAKAEVRAIPVVGRLASLNRTVFVARADRMDVAAQVDRLRIALAEGGPVTIFPEGTTGDGAVLLPFKPALLAALDPGPPGIRVQPVRIDYGAATGELAWTGDETGAAHALRVFGRRGPFMVRLAFLDPFAPATCGGRKAIAAEARRRIEESR